MKVIASIAACVCQIVLIAGITGVMAQETGDAPTASASRLFSSTTTASGQPIVLPGGNVEVVVWTYEIPVGARLPVHKHPFPRYAYVLAGTLQVIDADNVRTWNYKAGDFIVEMIDAWHFGTNTGTETVRLLVIDQVEPGRRNTIVR